MEACWSIAQGLSGLFASTRQRSNLKPARISKRAQGTSGGRRDEVPMDSYLIDTHLSASHLRLVVAIVEERCLVGAAKRLNMTQPAVTKALQAAEHQLGVPLFTRTSNGMVPTIYGYALASRARLVLTQLRSAVREINDLREGTGGRIVVGTLLAASAVLLPAAIAQLRDRCRKVVVTVVEGTNDLLIPSLRRGDVDLVVGRLPFSTDFADLQQEVLFVDAACIVVRTQHPLVGRQGLTLADLVHWDWILPPQATTLRSHIDKAFREEGVDPPVPAVESVCLPINQTLLQVTDYLSVWPRQVASHAAQIKEITVLPIPLPATECPIGITSRRNTPCSPAVEHFVETLRSVAQMQGQSLITEGMRISDPRHIPFGNSLPK